MSRSGGALSKPAADSQPEVRQIRIALAVVAVCAASVYAAFAFDWDWVVGDPLTYFARMDSVFRDGQIPYLEAEFEHLPLMLIPMSLVWLVGGSVGPFVFRGLWALASMLALTLTAFSMSRLGREIRQPRLDRKWLALMVPLIPVALFRTEPWVVLPAVLALVAAERDIGSRAGLWTAVGTVGKGWPALIAVAAWLRGRSRWPLIALATGVFLVVPVLLSPGFGAARDFQGVHSETLGGGLAGLLQSVGGGGVDILESAGAAYVQASSWWLLPGLLAGVAIAARALVGVNREAGLLPLTGSLVAALMLASPLQSTQFLIWLVPFLAAARSYKVRWMGFFMGALGLAMLVGFEGLLAGETAWFLGVVLRNALLIACGWGLAREVESLRTSHASA